MIMEEDFTFEVLAGFSLILVTVGVFGNALTIASVIYAKVKKKYNFDSTDWLNSTVFILNLTFVDMTYCLFLLIMLAYSFLVYLKFEVGETYSLCKFFVLGIQNLATIDGWSIALIAFTQAFPTIR